MRLRTPLRRLKDRFIALCVSGLILEAEVSGRIKRKVSKISAKAKPPQKKADPLNTFVGFQATPEMKEALLAKANKFTEGNLSEWLRIAGLGHVPLSLNGGEFKAMVKDVFKKHAYKPPVKSASAENPKKSDAWQKTRSDVVIEIVQADEEINYGLW